MVTNYRYCCTRVLPAVYQDVLSEWENICKMVAKLNEVIDVTNKQEQQFDDVYQIAQDLQNQVTEFIAKYEDFLNTGALPTIMEALEKFVKQIFFGLTDDGYFCAYIPDSWDDITFFTESNFGNPNYGRLQLWY